MAPCGWTARAAHRFRTFISIVTSRTVIRETRIGPQQNRFVSTTRVHDGTELNVSKYMAVIDVATSSIGLHALGKPRAAIGLNFRQRSLLAPQRCCERWAFRFMV